MWVRGAMQRKGGKRSYALSVPPICPKHICRHENRDFARKSGKKSVLSSAFFFKFVFIQTVLLTRPVRADVPSWGTIKNKQAGRQTDRQTDGICLAKQQKLHFCHTTWVWFWFLLGALSDDVVNLEDHFDNLRCQQKLLLFGNQGIKHVLFFHVCPPHKEKKKKKKNIELTIASLAFIEMGGGGCTVGANRIAVDAQAWVVLLDL